MGRRRAARAASPVRRRSRKVGLFFLGVQLLVHAVAAFMALLAFAGLARFLHRRFRLLGTRLAGFRVFRLRAHLVAHAVPVRRALPAFAGLGGLVARLLHLGAALLAGFGVLG